MSFIKRSLAVWGLACITSACSTLVPESYVTSTSPVDAGNSLGNAVAYASKVSREFEAIQASTSQTQAALNVATLGLATLAGAHVAYNHNINPIKGVALGLGLVGGTEYLLNPSPKRAVLDQGLMALSCARQTAHMMDTMPDAFTHQQPAATNPSPLAQYIRTLPTPALAIVPTPTIASRVNIARGNSIGDMIRAYGTKLNGNKQPPSPMAPYSSSSRSARAALAPVVMATADAHDEAMNSASTAADQVKASAPEYLVSTTESIARIVLAKLHAIDPTTKDVAATLTERNDHYLSSLQATLISTQKALRKTEAELKAVDLVTAATAGGAGNGATAGNDGQPSEDVKDAETKDSPPATPLVAARGRSSTSPRIKTPPRPEVVAQAEKDQNETSDQGKAANAGVQQEQALLDVLTQLTAASVKCGNAGR